MRLGEKAIVSSGASSGARHAAKGCASEPLRRLVARTPASMAASRDSGLATVYLGFEHEALARGGARARLDWNDLAVKAVADHVGATEQDVGRVIERPTIAPTRCRTSLNMPAPRPPGPRWSG